jgi:phosphoglycerol geranylgeranyltransferase
LVRDVEEYLKRKIMEKGAIHMTLLDPQKTSSVKSSEISEEAEKAGTSAIMVGGSTLASISYLDAVVKKLKERIEIPVILFPNNVSGISSFADAIWFMSLLNSSSTYYLIDVQALTAHLIREQKIEALPMGYLIVGEGGAAGFIGQARRIPYDHPELAVGYSLAAEILGMRFIYLEAGSGAKKPVPKEMIRLVKNQIKSTLIVGGGIRNSKDAFTAVEAGADIIVTGTLVEETSLVRESINKIVSSIESIER